jgi:heptosyltransferase-2
MALLGLLEKAMAAAYLVLQPAFLGDAVLTLPLIGRLCEVAPKAEVHWVLRKGHEELLQGHPWITQLWPWDKRWATWFRLWHTLRKRRWQAVFTVHRYLRMGLLGRLLPAELTITFDKNPLSWAYHCVVPHTFELGLHEVSRNLSLVGALGVAPSCPAPPWLFPPPSAWEAIKPYLYAQPYLVVAPTSRWPTKEAPFALWAEFLSKAALHFQIYLTGAPSDWHRLESLTHPPRIQNLAGQLSLLEVAALLAHAYRVFTVDSATTHLASAMGTPTTTIYCATTPVYGFGPLAPYSRIVELQEVLPCRPCGLHGHRRCPKGHFRCGHALSVQQLYETLSAAPPPESRKAASPSPPTDSAPFP